MYLGRPISHSQTTYEQACILYNIGALHSILGALDNRQTPEVFNTLLCGEIFKTTFTNFFIDINKAIAAR